METHPNRKDIEQAEAVIATLAAEHPHIRRELDRLEPPDMTSERLKLVRPPPSVRLTLAAAGAAAVMPGIHYIHFFSRSLEIRPEILRMTADLSRAPDPPDVRVYTRHRRALRAGLGSSLETEQEWDEVDERMVTYSRSEALRHLHAAEGRRGLLLVDLDDLAKGIRFADLHQLYERNGFGTILLFGNREHPLLHAYRYLARRQARWIQWGVSREQIQVLDGTQTDDALEALRVLNPSGYEKMPHQFKALDRTKVIPPQLRSMPQHEQRLWCTLAASYAVGSARRRGSIDRSILPVDDEVRPILDEAAKRIRSLHRRLSRGLASSPAMAQAIDDLAYFASLPSRLSIPVHSYVRKLEPSAVTRLSKPVDRLVEISEACLRPSGDREDVRAEVRDVAIALENFYSDKGQVKRTSARTHKITDLMNATLAAGNSFTLLALNRAEAEAAEAYFGTRINENNEQGPSRAERRRLLTVVEARYFSPDADVGTVAVARMPTIEIVDRVIEASIDAFVIVVPKPEGALAEDRLHFDRHRETNLLGPECQDVALSVMIRGEHKPKLTRLSPPAGPTTIPGDDLPRFSQGTNEEVTSDSDAPNLEDGEYESLLETILQNDAPSNPDGPTTGPRPDIPPRCLVLPSEHILVLYDDGTHDLVTPEDVLLCIREYKTEPEAISVEYVQVGDIILTTNSEWGSTRFADIVVDLLTKHEPKLNALDYIDRAWRDAIRDLKRTKTWAEILTMAQKHGYDNVSPLSILFYAKRAVWLPQKKSNLAAVLKAVSPDELGRPEMVEQIWNGTSRLRTLASRVLQHAKVGVRKSIPVWDDEMADPVIIEELGLRKSHCEGLFEFRRVMEVKPTAAGTEVYL